MSGINRRIGKAILYAKFNGSKLQRIKSPEDSLPIYFYFNKVHIIEVQLDSKIFLPPIQNRFLGYSLRVVSPFRQHTDQLITFWVTPAVKFVTYHSFNPLLAF